MEIHFFLRVTYCLCCARFSWLGRFNLIQQKGEVYHVSLFSLLFYFACYVWISTLTQGLMFLCQVGVFDLCLWYRENNCCWECLSLHSAYELVNKFSAGEFMQFRPSDLSLNTETVLSEYLSNCIWEMLQAQAVKPLNSMHPTSYLVLTLFHAPIFCKECKVMRRS